MKGPISLAFIMLFAGLETGCVGNMLVDPPIPLAIKSVPVSKGTIRVLSVMDDRNFSNQNEDTAIASIDDESRIIAKERIIGRMSDAFGKPLWNVVLVPGESVVDKTRILVESSLEMDGFRIARGRDAETTVDVTIKDFWAWSDVAFHAIYFRVKIKADLSFKTKDGRQYTVTAAGSGENPGQINKIENWNEAFETAFSGFAQSMKQDSTL